MAGHYGTVFFWLYTHLCCGTIYYRQQYVFISAEVFDWSHVLACVPHYDTNWPSFLHYWLPWRSFTYWCHPLPPRRQFAYIEYVFLLLKSVDFAGCSPRDFLHSFSVRFVFLFLLLYSLYGAPLKITFSLTYTCMWRPWCCACPSTEQQPSLPFCCSAWQTFKTATRKPEPFFRLDRRQNIDQVFAYASKLKYVCCCYILRAQ